MSVRCGGYFIAIERACATHNPAPGTGTGKSSAERGSLASAFPTHWDSTSVTGRPLDDLPPTPRPRPADGRKGSSPAGTALAKTAGVLVTAMRVLSGRTREGGAHQRRWALRHGSHSAFGAGLVLPLYALLLRRGVVGGAGHRGRWMDGGPRRRGRTPQTLLLALSLTSNLSGSQRGEPIPALIASPVVMYDPRPSPSSQQKRSRRLAASRTSSSRGGVVEGGLEGDMGIGPSTAGVME